MRSGVDYKAAKGINRFFGPNNAKIILVRALRAHLHAKPILPAIFGVQLNSHNAPSRHLEFPCSGLADDKDDIL